MINLIFQGNLGGGKNAIVPTAKNNIPIIKMIKNSNIFTPLHNIISIQGYHSKTYRY